MEDSLGEYDRPLIYDAEYGGYQGDFDLFLNLINQGKVLDLACGTGRLTIPFAQKGMQVTGLERSEPMLERAMEKAEGLDIKWFLGDITNFDLDEKFDLIALAGNSFQALLTSEDQLHLFRTVKAHLKPTGMFVFDTRNPQPAEFKSTEDFEYWHSFQDFSRETVRVYGKQTLDFNKQIVTYTTKRIWQDHETVTTIELKYSNKNDLLNMLHQEGFHNVDVFGDYNKSEFLPSSNSIIAICS